MEITIRPAYGDDQVALRRLAELDSAAAVPSGPLLLAEVDGELRAALSLSDGSSIADPFRPTAELVELLIHASSRAHAGRRARRRWWRGGRRPAPARAALA